MLVGLVVLGLLVGGIVAVGAASPGTATVVSAGLAHSGGLAVLDSGLVAFVVSEAGQGATDFNGDGDATDFVVHVLNPATGLSANTGLASGGFVVAAGSRVAFPVSEAMHGGTDFNGDGDTGDSVVHVFDPATGITLGTGLAFASNLRAVGDRVVFLVSESDQGGTDLNGDGDSFDPVLHGFDPVAGTSANSGLAGLFATAVGGRVAIDVHEGLQGGTDLNGDGDSTDTVVHVFDPVTGMVANSGLAWAGGFFVAVGDAVALEVSEADQGATDLNGDADSADSVAHFFNPTTGTAINSGFAVGFSGLSAVGSRAASTVPEAGQGAGDLNGDGDTGDDVVHLFDPVTGAATNLGLAFGGSGMAAVGDRLTFTVSEAGQGGADLNGDGDTGDEVVHAFDPATGAVANSRLAVGGFGLRALRDRVAFEVSESSQGASDFNGDGDSIDSVVHAFDPVTNTSANSRLAADVFAGLRQAGDQVAVAVPESGQGAGDLNGDGDTADVVVHVFDPIEAAALNLELAVDSSSPVFRASGRVGALSVPEASQGGADLSGDGDALDAVLHTVTLNTAPVAAADSAVVAEGATLVVNGVLDNDFDREGDAMTAIHVSGPAHGTVALEPDGSYVYVHDGSETTSDSFTYVAHDGSLPSDPAAVTITVTPVDDPHTVGLVDPSQGRWHLRNEGGEVISFFYGNPADLPFMGDWDCDGDETPGLFRTSDAFAYLRNSNTAGIADIRFFFGNPDDVPLAGDWNGDGCDTLSIYRPSEQRFYIINQLGENEGGLGQADFFFTFGNPGDKPVAGDWDGDGIDEVGLHRESTGFFYFRNTLTTGIADGEFFFGDPNDRFVAGDWGIVDSKDTPAVFRPSNTTMFFRHTLTAGVADSEFVFGESPWLPVAGTFGLG